MTSYLPSHPGGDALLERAGKDVSFAMSTVDMHFTARTTIEQKLKERYVGDLK
jgi:cytochrome b involved in lipid metabolism